MILELLGVAARAALEWALASLLLANGAAFCLIAAAAARLRLAPPCILCARVHRLLRPSSSSSSAAAPEDRDALHLLLCRAHLAAAVAGSSAHPDPRDGAEADGPTKFEGMETHRVVSIGSEICDQDERDGSKPHASAADDDSSSNGPLVSLFELAPIVSRPREDGGGGGGSIDQAATTMPAPSLTEDDDADERLSVGELAAALRAQRRELDALRVELAFERRARAEAEEYQRQLEEQGELDREAARLAMQLVHESETEKHGLQRQLDACRVRAQLCRHSSEAAAAVDDGGDASNNYQSLVDFLPGSVYSSSPDLANLLKLYTESGNGGTRRLMSDDHDTPAIAVVEEEEEEEVAVAVTVKAGTESAGSVDATSAIVAESLLETSTNSFHVETVTEAA